MYAIAHKPLIAGVALIGAAAIAAGPVTPPLPDSHLPAVYSGAVQLTTTYQDFFHNTVLDVQDLVGNFVAAPAPVLTQIAINQYDNISGLVEGLVKGVTGSFTALTTTTPKYLQRAVASLQIGDLTGATEYLIAAAEAPLGPLIADLTPAVQIAVANPVLNVAKTLEILLQPGLINDGIDALTGPLFSIAVATAQEVQDVVGGKTNILTALIDAPATIADAVLNGSNGQPGLLTSDGPIGYTHGALVEIAKAIDPPPGVLQTLSPASATAPKVATLAVKPAAATVGTGSAKSGAAATAAGSAKSVSAHHAHR